MGVDPDKELVRTVLHLVGQSRAYEEQLQNALAWLRETHDERASRAIEALELTLRKPAGPGTVRHVKEATSALLWSLREDRAG